MEYALPVGIVIGVLIIGFFMKQLKIFIILALLAGAGAWMYLLDDEQKESVTKSITESAQFKELNDKAKAKLDDVTEQIEKTLDETEENVKNKSIEIYKEQTDKLSND